MIDVGGKIAVLIADDDKDIRKFLKLILTKFKSEIYEAQDGEEALKIITEKKISIAFLDVNMPKASGLDVLKKVKATNNEIICIMFTGLNDSETVKDCFKSGAHDYIEKPCSKHMIEAVIKRAMSLAIYVQERTEFIESLVCEYGKISLEKFRSYSYEEQAKMLSMVQAVLKLKMSNRELD